MKKKVFSLFLTIAYLFVPVYCATPVIPYIEPVYAATSAIDHSYMRKYEELLSLKTTSYQEMTITQFRENAISFLDTPENMKLLQKALEDNHLQFHRFTDKNAFFICNTLGPLAYDHWQKSYITGGVERRLNQQLVAELEFRSVIKILNPDTLIAEYEKAYSGLADTALRFLKSQKSADLSDETADRKSVV